MLEVRSEERQFETENHQIARRRVLGGMKTYRTTQICRVVEFQFDLEGHNDESQSRTGDIRQLKFR
jgi:hypothetical protein